MNPSFSSAGRSSFASQRLNSSAALPQIEWAAGQCAARCSAGAAARQSRAELPKTACTVTSTAAAPRQRAAVRSGLCHRRGQSKFVFASLTNYAAVCVQCQGPAGQAGFAPAAADTPAAGFSVPSAAAFSMVLPAAWQSARAGSAPPTKYGNNKRAVQQAKPYLHPVRQAAGVQAAPMERPPAARRHGPVPTA